MKSNKRSVFLIYGEQAVTVSFKVPESKRDEIVSEIRDNVLSKYENPQRVEIDIKEKEQRESSDIASQKPTSIAEIPTWKQTLEKKSNPTDDVFTNAPILEKESFSNIPFTPTTKESYDGEKAKSLLVDEAGQFLRPSKEEMEELRLKVNPTDYKLIVPIENFREVESDIVGVGKLATTVSDVKKDKVKALQEMADVIKSGGGAKSELFATKKKPIDEIYDCIIVERGIPQEADRIYYGSNNRIAFWDRDDSTVYYINWESKYYRFVNSNEFNKFIKDNNIK